MKKLFVVLAAVMALGVVSLGYVLLNKQPEQPKGNTNVQEQATPATETSEVKTITVKYDENGFSPTSVTISKGSTVKFINNWSYMPMWVASNPHPAHTSYPELDTSAEFQTEVPPGNESYSFTFEKPGTWGYHNHSAPEHTATIVVE